MKCPKNGNLVILLDKYKGNLFIGGVRWCQCFNAWNQCFCQISEDFCPYTKDGNINKNLKNIFSVKHP